MSKPYSVADFSSQVSEDRNWRIKEISDLKTAVRRADAGLQRVLLRAIVTIGYAHWEGHIRFTAQKFLEHVALRKFSFRDLDRQFLKNFFLRRLSAISASGASVAARCDLVEEILTASDRRFSKVDDEWVNTKANLSYAVLSDICLVCGIPLTPFVDKEIFIDKVLLKRRNAIAHGEDALVALNELDSIASDTIELMRTFGDSLENRVVLQTFKAA